jgi:Rad3-related DNA helicase
MLEKEIKSSRFLFHADAREREAILAEHARSQTDTILVSPSMTVGVDLKGDLADFGIILKAPFLYLGDERIRRLFDEDKNWYNWKTLQEIMQMCGRIHRDDNDDTVMYILDGDAIRLIHQSSKIVPDWWRAGLYMENCE